MTEAELAEMRQKWEAFGSRLKEGDGVEGSLIGASFIIARSGVTDVLALLDHFAEVERTARGLVRTAHPEVGKHEVVRSWWDALVESLGSDT